MGSDRRSALRFQRVSLIRAGKVPWSSDQDNDDRYQHRDRPESQDPAEVAPVGINVPAPGIARAMHHRSQQYTAPGVVENPGEPDRGDDHEYRVSEKGGEQANLGSQGMLERSLDEEQRDMPDRPHPANDQA